MKSIEFFKLQAKNLIKDYKTQFRDKNQRYKPHFFNITEIVSSFNIDETASIGLMRAQHIVAQLAGFKKWAEMIATDESQLKLGKLLLATHRNKGVPIFLQNYDKESYQDALKAGEYQKVENWCKKRLLPYMTRKTINKKHSSYGLKHICEDELGIYVGNGTLIMALHNLGIKGLRPISNGQNWPNYNYPIDENFFKAKTPTDIEEMKQGKAYPKILTSKVINHMEKRYGVSSYFDNPYSYFIAQLEDWYISKSSNGRAKITTELNKWDKQAQKIIVDNLTDALTKKGFSKPEIYESFELKSF